MARTKTSYDVPQKPSVPFDMDALVQGGPDLEVVQGDKDYQKVAEDAAFMEEMIEIRFLGTGDVNAPKMVEVGVGTSAPDGKSGGKSTRRGFMRGKVYTVPRFMFEVLAHAKVSTLKQVQDPRNPMELLNVVEHSFFYPFECVNDPNPKGEAWREKVLADPC